jgi:hypothetical protein
LNIMQPSSADIFLNALPAKFIKGDSGQQLKLKGNRN